MAASAWIKHHMNWEPKDMIEHRKPIEAELRVRRALQQLPIPDWYLNKCTSSPKIINDRRPIESRPPAWKHMRSDKISEIDPIRASKNPSGNLKRAYRAEEQNEESPKMSVSASAPSENATPIKRAAKSKSVTNISKTFPKISPSRKIQNINIVFPSKQENSSKSSNGSINADKIVSQSPKLATCSVKETQSVETFMPIRNTPNKFIHNKTMTESPITPRISTTGIPLRASEIKSPSVGSSNSKTPSISTSGRSPIKGSGKEETPAISTSQKTFRSPRMNCPPPAVPSTALKVSQSGPVKALDPCRTKLFTTPKKSTAMENVIKSHQKRSPRKTLVEEIIQELNSKCSKSSKSTYVTPGSKNFVKRLVDALEKGCVPEHVDEDNVSESCSDTDCKSGPSSTSISCKDSDSGSGSDTDQKSPSSKTSRDSPFRNFAYNLGENRKDSRKPFTAYVDDEDDSVYWIPLPSCKLPRTSSLRSMLSRLSFNSGQPSPIASPVRGMIEVPSTSQLQATSGWGKTFDRRRPSSRQLVRIEETLITDSGYSDRSGTNSSSSSVIDGSWFGESETTQTASELGYDSETSQMTQTTHPHRLSSYRQRTFVI